MTSCESGGIFLGNLKVVALISMAADFMSEPWNKMFVDQRRDVSKLHQLELYSKPKPDLSSYSSAVCVTTTLNIG